MDQRNGLTLNRDAVVLVELDPTDDPLDRLHVVYSIEVGLVQANQGLLIPNERLKPDLRRWAQ